MASSQELTNSTIVPLGPNGILTNGKCQTNLVMENILLP